MKANSSRLLFDGRQTSPPAVPLAQISDQSTHGVRTRIRSAVFPLFVTFLLLTLVSKIVAVGDKPTNQNNAPAFKSVESSGVFFITLPPSTIPISPTPQQIQQARSARESRPAAQDLEGHWGDATEGCQLSLRFEQKSVQSGKPIVAIVFIRNVTDKKVVYRDFVGMGEDSPVCQFDILDEAQQLVARINPKAPRDIADGPHVPRLLNPGTQCRYEVKLDAKFNLNQPGKYSVRARRWVHKLDRDGYSELKSGQAVILLKPTNTGGGPNSTRPTDPPSVH